MMSASESDGVQPHAWHHLAALPIFTVRHRELCDIPTELYPPLD
jgi:hypothetical protein